MKRIWLSILIGLFLVNTVFALNLSRVKTWSTSEILTASDLNAEFDNILNHSIANADISATAAIVGSKLDLSVPGVIGGTTPAAGSFTNLTATGNTTLGNGADTVTFNSSSGLTFTPAATWTFTDSQTVSGTWANLGIVTTVDMNGGTIDGATIGGSSAGAITGTTVSATTAIRAADGSATVPSLSFTSDSNTGLYTAGDILRITTAGVDRAQFQAGYSYIVLGTTTDVGDASNYVDDFHYHTLAAHSLIWADDGVELQNGEKVSDLESILRLKPSKTQSDYDKPLIDKKSFPKNVFMPAAIQGRELPRDENDVPYDTDKDGNKISIPRGDGVNTTYFLSILTGAIKELNTKINDLEVENNKLKKIVEELDKRIEKLEKK